MGKSEVLMIIAGIALSIMIALVTIPTFTKGSDVAKISLINSDISSIRKVSQTYVESKSSTGDFKNINAEALSSLIPGLDTKGTGDDSYFISSANKKIEYKIGTNSNKDELVITITGLKEINGAKESILKNQEKLNVNTNQDPNELKVGTIILHFKG